MLEAGFNKYLTSALTAIGHRVLSAPPELSQGAVQAIRRLKDGTIHGILLAARKVKLTLVKRLVISEKMEKQLDTKLCFFFEL